jgi:hypothetical protein
MMAGRAVQAIVHKRRSTRHNGERRFATCISQQRPKRKDDTAMSINQPVALQDVYPLAANEYESCKTYAEKQAKEVAA